MLHDIVLPFTTTAGGAATVTPAFWPGPSKLLAVLYDRGTVDAGADLTISYDLYDVVETLLTITNAGAADVVWYPRRVVQGNTGANLTGLAGGDVEPYLVMGRPQLVVAQGGNALTGAVILVVQMP